MITVFTGDVIISKCHGTIILLSTVQHLFRYLKKLETWKKVPLYKKVM